MDNNVPMPSTSSRQPPSIRNASSNWCSFESVPPPVPFDLGCSLVQPNTVFYEANPVSRRDKQSNQRSITVRRRISDPGVLLNRSGPNGEVISPLSTSFTEGRPERLKPNNGASFGIVCDDDDPTSSSFFYAISKDGSSSNSSASEARISSAPLGPGQIPEHTLSDISGPCSSSLIGKEDGKRVKRGGNILQETTTSTSSSLSDSETEETEDHREFLLSSATFREESRKGSLELGGAEIFEQPIVPMTVDTCEDYWTRLHDIRINGCILEYVGIGKSIHDNGFAQSRVPLSPISHYFEITILDPGENCYISIGLARKDYNVHKNPGWCRGSIAFHADDGKIFIGGGVGTPFGPRCGIRDVLGCGVIFPVKYGELPAESNWPWEVEDLSDTETAPKSRPQSLRKKVRVGYSPDNFGEGSSESEDDIWWNNKNQVCEDKVQVFFMRNGKLLGIKEVRVPHGGLFPTIGMMSTNERVSVDLHPLSG